MGVMPLSSARLRERGKARRLAGIVTAASDLWRELGVESVSLGQIAAAAEVAPQTIYNLIGGIDALGFAVVKQALTTIDSQIAEAGLEGVELAIRAVRISSEVLIADAKLYRQVIVRIPRALFDGTHLGRDTADVSIMAVTQAIKAGEVVSAVDPDWLGRSIHINYLGALYDWAWGDSGPDVFLRRTEIAALSPLAACATASSRQMLTGRLLAALAPDDAVVAVGDK